MLVHIANNVVCLSHLGNLAERLVGIPFYNLAHVALGMFCRRAVMQETVKIVRVGRIGHHDRAVGCRSFGSDKVCTGLSLPGCQSQHTRQSSEKDCFLHVIFMLLLKLSLVPGIIITGFISGFPGLQNQASRHHHCCRRTLSPQRAFCPHQVAETQRGFF